MSMPAVSPRIPKSLQDALAIPGPVRDFASFLVKYARTHSDEMDDQMATWQGAGIYFPHFVTAYFLSRGSRSCLRVNHVRGDGLSIGQGCVNRDKCYFTHICLFCGGDSHGMFGGHCAKYTALEAAVPENMSVEEVADLILSEVTEMPPERRPAIPSSRAPWSRSSEFPALGSSAKVGADSSAQAPASLFSAPPGSAPPPGAPPPAAPRTAAPPATAPPASFAFGLSTTQPPPPASHLQQQQPRAPMYAGPLGVDTPALGGGSTSLFATEPLGYMGPSGGAARGGSDGSGGFPSGLPGGFPVGGYGGLFGAGGGGPFAGGGVFGSAPSQPGAAGGPFGNGVFGGGVLGRGVTGSGTGPLFGTSALGSGPLGMGGVGGVGDLSGGMGGLSGLGGLGGVGAMGGLGGLGVMGGLGSLGGTSAGVHGAGGFFSTPVQGGAMPEKPALAVASIGTGPNHRRGAVPPGAHDYFDPDEPPPAYDQVDPSAPGDLAPAAAGTAAAAARVSAGAGVGASPGTGGAPVGPPPVAELMVDHARVTLFGSEPVHAGPCRTKFRGLYDGQEVHVTVMPARVRFDAGLESLLASRAILHPNVLSFVAQCPSDAGSRIVVTEATDTSLAEVFTRSPHALGKPLVRERICYQIAAGMDALHRARLLHRDLAPRSVLLVCSPLRVKLADFALSYASPAGDQWLEYYPDVISLPGGGVARARECHPLEVIRGAPFSVESDVWAFGMLALELYTLQPPFGPAPLVDDIVRVLQTNALRTDMGADAPPAVREAVAHCVRAPKSRPSFAVLATMLAPAAGLDVAKHVCLE